MIRKMLFAAALLAIATTEVRAQALPQADFGSGFTQSHIAGQLALECMSGGFAVTQQDVSGVVCQKQMTGADAAATMFLFGGFRGGAPQQTVRFAIVRVDGTTLRVQGSAYLETFNGYGAPRVQPLNGPDAQNAILATLYKIGGR